METTTIISTDYAVPSYTASFSLPKQNYSIKFHRTNENGFVLNEIGCLDFNGPVMKFEGEMEESARVFFNYIADVFAGRLKEEYQRGYEDCLTDEGMR